MVPGIIKIPKHGGPDGQGLPVVVIEELILLIKNQLRACKPRKSC
jgi:hypothetical protein